MISILGCSGVGKSTVIQQLVKLLPDSQVLNENITEALGPIKQQSFTSPYDKFIATQDVFISRDISALAHSRQLAIFDNRLAEYVFYLLHHPQFKYRNSESEKRLGDKITCVLDHNAVRAFYLSDNIQNIESKVKMDVTRARKSWSFFVDNMFPFHENWHREQGAKVIDVRGKTPTDIAYEIVSRL